MDLIGLLGAYDVGAIIAILMFTSLIKTYINITERFVPLIPVVLGAIAGLLKFFIDTSFGTMTWYNIIAALLMSILVYSGIAMLVFKVYKTTLMKDKPVVTDAIKKML
jgi:hypothetical protein